MSRRRSQISGQFSAHLIEMLRSPAHRVLSLGARRVLDRIEIELADHGGTDNGRLPVTYADFEEYGLDRGAIAPAIREAAALGFLELVEKGRRANGDVKSPNRFRLTYRPAKNIYGDGSHEWRAIKTIEEAAAIARDARSAIDEENPNAKRKRAKASKFKNVFSGAGFPHCPGGENPHCKTVSPVGKTRTPGVAGKPAPLSISREGGPLSVTGKSRPAVSVRERPTRAQRVNPESSRPPINRSEHEKRGPAINPASPSPAKRKETHKRQT